MSTEEKLSILRLLPRFSGVAEDELERLAARAVEAIAAPGDVLAREARPEGRTAFYVLTGEATVATHGSVIDKVGSGTLLVDLDDPPSTVTAITLMHLLVLDMTDLAGLPLEQIGGVTRDE